MIEDIRRGEIWIVNLDPTVGSEIKKSRPAVVISSDALGKLPLKLVAPITKWKSHFEDNIWHIKVMPNDTNKLREVSAVDVLQSRCVDVQRLVNRIGSLSAIQLREIVYALAAIVELEI